MLPDRAVQDFRSSLRGALLLPGDEGYDAARTLHNAMIDRRPALIARCAGVADVIASVNFARANNLLVSVRGGGHNVAGLAVCDDGLMIDLSRMKGIHADPQARTVRVEAGCTWGEVNHELQPFDLAATGGFVSVTGVGGLTLGGGLGWLVRKHGLALDNLITADVVTAAGRLVTASATENEDLFWGIRGGGGNFGIVTSFKFRAHPVGTVLAGLVLHPLSRGRQALRFWRDFEAKAPEEMSNSLVLFTSPPDLPLPAELKSGPIVGLGGVYAGAIEAGEQAMRPLREFGPPAADTYQVMPYSAAQSMADFVFPAGLLNYWKGGYLKEFNDGVIDTILRFAATVPSPHTVVIVEHDGDGAIERVPDDATAFGHRAWPYNFLVTSAWKDAADTEKNVRWTRDFYDGLRPYLADAAYVNFLGEAGDESVRLAYGAKVQRLVALKDKYDPDNLFCMNHNIRPSRAGAGREAASPRRAPAAS